MFERTNLWLGCMWIFTCLGIGSGLGGEVTSVHEDFTRDPAWDGHNNRPSPATCVDKAQDFGYSRSAHAGGHEGEIGGVVWRSIIPASYARKIPTRTLNDRLRASGRFCVTASSGGSGVLVGWFNHDSRGWRTPNSLVFRIDGEANKFRVFFEYGTQGWKTGCGQTFEGKYQTTTTAMLKADGMLHTWSLEYDPDACNGRGGITYTLDGKSFRCTLGEGHKLDGAAFDRFGILNVQSSGSSLTLWLDDVELDGQKEDFSADPSWESFGSRQTFRDCRVRPFHDFGWSDTQYTGGSRGEVGGLMWRIEKEDTRHEGYYAKSVGHLTLDHALHASGKLSLRGAGADSAIQFGWFNASTAVEPGSPNFLGILIEGPSRIGHYVRPICRPAQGQGWGLKTGPVIHPDGSSHRWTLDYEPSAAEGNGRITTTFDGQPVTIDLTRKADAVFDHFGFLSCQPGGTYVEIYFDDLTFTADTAR